LPLEHPDILELADERVTEGVIKFAMMNKLLNDLHLLLEEQHAGAVQGHPILSKGTTDQSIQTDPTQRYHEHLIAHLNVVIRSDVPWRAEKERQQQGEGARSDTAVAGERRGDRP
jgi:hypothetical protein